MSASTCVTIDTADGPMTAYEVRPANGARGAVVVIQEAFGLTTHIEHVARRIAAAGWYAIAPGILHRQGDPTPIFAYDDLDSVLPAMGRMTAEGIETDLAATFEYVAAIGFEPARTGIVGFCMGGSVAFLAATQYALGGAVTFYGGGVRQGRFGVPALLDLAPNLRTPWLGLYGDLDVGIPIDELEELRAVAADTAVDTDIVRYPEADHGFNCNDRPAVFNADAAAAAWQRMLEWFDTHLAATVDA
ncbi:MAG: carboxymethylenebutenolidase [Pseudonocardiales bacterium]|nr:carboxymethylenebutenolidase [Pseudonocardiales bacterium]